MCVCGNFIAHGILNVDRFDPFRASSHRVRRVRGAKARRPPLTTALTAVFYSPNYRARRRGHREAIEQTTIES